jgi:mono/diheme cytochrome c family protein
MIVVASALASGLLHAQEEGNRGQGLTLAQTVCIACHAIDKRQEVSPNPAAPRFEVIANVPGMTAMALTVALRTPHKTMPNLVLEGDEIRNVAAYILSLK